MNDANDFDVVLCDPPIPDLPSSVCRYKAARHVLLKEGVS